MSETLQLPKWVVHEGDCLEFLKTLPDESVDVVATDPPYGLSNHTSDDIIEALRAWLSDESYQPKKGSRGFMGKSWDAFVPGPEVWRECFRVLKPGGHLAAFAGTRTQDLMGIAIRLAGFDMRDTIRVDGLLAWVYGSGFPKSLNVSKAADGADAAKAWDGWGTALKPSHEPILVFRKPLIGTVIENVLAHGTGAMNIDACRVGAPEGLSSGGACTGSSAMHWNRGEGISEGRARSSEHPAGRWPSNLVLCHTPDCVQVGEKTVPGRVINRFDDGMKPFGGGAGHSYTSEGGEPETIPTFECAPGCPIAALDEQSGVTSSGAMKREVGSYDGESNTQFLRGRSGPSNQHGDTGGASRFFPQFQYTTEDAPFQYVAKASRAERDEGLTPGTNKHPTVKPIDLVRWILRLLTPPGGRVLDPFNGSGTTGCASIMEGFEYIGIERDADSVAVSRARIEHHELKARGGVKNPWAAETISETEVEDTSVSMEDLFGFGE